MMPTNTTTRFQLSAALVMALLTSRALETMAAEAVTSASEIATSSANPFQATKVWQVHIEISPDEYAAMQPQGMPRFPGFGRPPSPDAPKATEEVVQEVHRNQFGVDLPWATGKITVGDQTLQNVGIRYKGNGTIMDASRSIKKSLKVETDKNGGTETLLGLKTINLHCGVTDPSKCRETLAYGLYREAGVPASQTALSEVWLTVPGKYEKEFLGVYTLVEQVGGAFLRAHFGSDKGLLMKPEGVRDLEYLGDDWSSYEPKYLPKGKVSEKEVKRVIDFTRLIHQADDVEFNLEIGAFIDVDEYLRFLATTAFIANSDSFFVLGHNYYLYLHPETGQFHFIPWDLDRAFANFFILGSQAQQMDLSLKHPYAGTHRLTDRLLNIPEVSARYHTLLEELAEGCFDKERLLRELNALDTVTEDLVARDKRAAEARREGRGGGFGPAGMFASPPDLETFIVNRTASVSAQLAGTSTGHVPSGGFGPGGFGGFGPPRGGPRRPPVGDMLARPILEALDTDEDTKLAKTEWVQAARNLFEECELDREGKADVTAIAAALDKRFPKPPANSPTPPGFTAGSFMASPIVKRADCDQDGKLSLDELTSAADKLFDEFDPAKTELLDQGALAKLLTELFPFPQFDPSRNRERRGN
jgi:spore coat protein CotH